MNHNFILILRVTSELICALCIRLHFFMEFSVCLNLYLQIGFILGIYFDVWLFLVVVSACSLTVILIRKIQRVEWSLVLFQFWRRFIFEFSWRRTQFGVRQAFLASFFITLFFDKKILSVFLTFFDWLPLFIKVLMIRTRARSIMT